MSVVLITGGAGFIGHHLGRRLDAVGWDVLSLDSLNPQVHLDPVVSRSRVAGTLIEGDITDEHVWQQVPEIDAVIHLAAETGVGQSMYESERYRAVNVEGTRRVAQFVAQRQVPLVFFSSRAVYGEGRRECVVHGVGFGAACCETAMPAPSCEDDPPNPVSVYGETKVAGESMLVAGAAGRAPVTIVRPQNVIGAGQALHNPYTGVLAAFLAHLRDDRPLLIYGDGHQTRDFIHVSDVARMVESLLASPPADGDPLVVNCGSGVRTTLVDLAQYAIRGAPVPGTFEHVEVHRAGDIDHACADVRRAQSLGLPASRVTAADAVAEFIRSGWDEPGIPSTVWDAALAELEDKGLTT